MRRLIRLMWYVRPYWPQLFASVVLFSLVGLLEAFRVALLGPIFNRVLAPDMPGNSLALLKIPHTHYTIYLEQLVPSHFHNPWTKVAFALVVSVFLKGIFDYVGTYLVSYAGFGLVTDLRNEIYESVLRRSAAFFQKHPTGTLVSTIINDIDKVQFAMSSVLAEFLQQFFIFLFIVVLVISVGGGNAAKNVSPNLVTALRYAREVGAAICGIVGRDGGYTAEVADACVIVPTVNPANVTPHTESFQALVWHLLVSHPLLKANPAKWESVGPDTSSAPKSKG